MTASTFLPRLTCTAAIAGLCALCAAHLHAQAPTPGVQPRDAARPAANLPPAEIPPTTEDQLKQQFLGKTFYLRGGWLDDNLHFDENGKLDGKSPQASFTLSLVEITRVHLAKHRQGRAD